MTTHKKVLVAYDGSGSAEALLEDLKQAGLPPKTDVLVVSIADVFLPPPGFVLEAGPEFAAIPVKGVGDGWAYALRQVEQSRQTARKAVEKIKKDFPKWEVRGEAFADSPVWGLIRKAQEWKADLILMGAHGFHAAGRLMLGSVSQLVLMHAPCSVRIVHRKPEEVNSPPRIVIGIDGSNASYEALQEAASRNWRSGTAFRLITAVDSKIKTAMLSGGQHFYEAPHSPETDAESWVRQMTDRAASELQARGLNVTVLCREGDPKKVLLEEAEQWGADSLFAGARGISGLFHNLTGSVSSSLAARAHCSVEVVRACCEFKSAKSGAVQFCDPHH